jgi:hypothetical protein
MAMINSETRTRPGTCPTHGQVTGEKNVPKLRFPFIITGIGRALAAPRSYRCPTCGAKTAASA